MADSETLLKVKNLHTWFEIKKWGFLSVGNVRAVDDVSFTLNEGEAVSLVGESGCGKSSLAKTILGLHTPEKGEIVFDNQVINNQDEEQMKWYRKNVGLIQQDPYDALPPFMNLRRILEEPMIINGVSDKQERLDRIHSVMKELKLTPVEDFLNKYPHMLSGGQQQRVVIARAIILNPNLILADEPVSMLDASVRVEILELLKQLQKEYNLSIIYITHDLSTVRYFSRRIFVMYGGKIVEKAPVKKLLSEPKHPYTKALLEAISEPDASNVETYKEVPAGEPPSLMNPPTGCRFHPRCEDMIEGHCDKREPQYYITGENHVTACFLYEKNLGEKSDIEEEVV